jgi:hypothetical protein
MRRAGPPTSRLTNRHVAILCRYQRMLTRMASQCIDSASMCIPFGWSVGVTYLGELTVPAKGPATRLPCGGCRKGDLKCCASSSEAFQPDRVAYHIVA